MNPQVPVDPGAADAEEDPQIPGGPAGAYG